MRVSDRLLVFLSALAVLMFELVVSRLADFHLGGSNAYLALPITFLGLALGSLHAHLSPSLRQRFAIERELAALAVVSFVSLMAAFVLFSRVMPPVSELNIVGRELYLLRKTFVFVSLMMPPFYVFGRILSVVYEANREHIGAIYSADFMGASLACALTPVLFHFTNLPVVLVVLFALTVLPAVLFTKGGTRTRLQLTLVGAAACALGAWLIHWSDSHIDFAGYRQGMDVTEISHRWNALSRVSVLRFDRQGKRLFYKIEHDNSRSNVHVTSYRPQQVGTPPDKFDAVEVPYFLARPARSMLVMFAGAGAEMVALNRYAGGRADLTGVELNPLVKELAATTRELKSARLAAFYALPNIHLVTAEGRQFLTSTKQRYDAIVVGTNAATGVLTGHSRKYLDTTRAFHLYLDHLTPSGVLVFDHQPIERRVTTMQKVFEERGLGSLKDRAVVLKSLSGDDDLVISPSGFSDEEIDRLFAATGGQPGRILYAPRGRGLSHRYDALMAGTSGSARPAITDDLPFLENLDVANYHLIPADGELNTYQRRLNWMKLTTLLLLTLISGFFLIVALWRKATRPPPSVLTLLILTGFAFMLVEVALMAKLELFLQEPILSMATVLSIFLATSAVGSALFERVRARLDMRVFPLLLALLVVATDVSIDALVDQMLALPILVKLLVSALVMVPVGVGLGFFYPYAVACLVRHGHGPSVAITYGISTLASVVGATYAMTAMLEFGFSSLLFQAAALYLLLGLFVVVYRGLSGRQLLTA